MAVLQVANLAALIVVNKEEAVGGAQTFAVTVEKCCDGASRSNIISPEISIDEEAGWNKWEIKVLLLPDSLNGLHQMCAWEQKNAE